MRKWIVGILVGFPLIAASAAPAADIPRAPRYKAPPPPVAYNWTGFYVGGNAGYGWGRAHDAMTLGGDWLTDGTFDNIPVQPLGNDQLKPNGFTGGLQAGFNYQTGAWVIGLEADANYFRLTASFSSTVLNPLSGNSYAFTSSFESDWLVTVRPRLGYAFDRLLVYATGGLAIANQEFSQNIVQLNLAFVEGGTVSKTTAGWTIGAGMEYALGNRVSLKAEYLYVDLGSVSFATAGFCPTDPTCSAYVARHEASLTASIVRAGINFNLGGAAPVVARY
jgi:outer membrane immunogenic protein